MTWFKLYTEFATDPKVQSMSEPLQRRLVLIFCLTAIGDLESLKEPEIAAALRISLHALAKTKKVFIEKGFIDSAWRLTNWTKRQTRSDFSSAERMKKWRNKQRDVTSPLRNGDGELRNSDVTISTRGREDSDSEKEIPLVALPFSESPPSTTAKTTTTTTNSDITLGPEYQAVGEHAIQLTADLSWGAWVDRQGLAGHSAEVIRAALDKASGSDKLAKPYVASILRDWAVNGQPVAMSRPKKSEEKPPIRSLGRPDLPRIDKYKQTHEMWDKYEGVIEEPS